MCVCMCVCMHVYMYMYVCMCVCVVLEVERGALRKKTVTEDCWHYFSFADFPIRLDWRVPHQPQLHP